MEKAEYIFDNAFWAVVSVISYRNLLFRSIPGRTLNFSQAVLYGLVVLLVTMGVVLTVSRSRRSISVLVNIITPYEVYSIIVFAKDMKILAAVSVCSALLLGIAYLALVMSHRTPNRARRARILRLRFRAGVNGSRTLAAACMAIFIIPMGFNALFGGTMAFKSTQAQAPTLYSDCTIEDNIDTLSNMRQDVWDTLNMSEKTDTLQTVANIEAAYLGLPHELNVKINTLQESTVAQYQDKTHTVIVNISYLDSDTAEDMLDSICHEAYHAYQRRLCDAYNSVDAEYRGLLTFADVPIYEEEFNNYESGYDDFYGYYLQTCESTAREYAKGQTETYYAQINMNVRSDGDKTT
jgi:predicted SprT family Zn-dependent metalloprotease